MFIEFKEGQKHAAKGADISESLEGFNDAGYILTDKDMVIDIDDLNRDQIDKIIEWFGIGTETVITDRGVHFYFKRPRAFARGNKKVCALGFPIELKHANNTAAITVKLNGKAREVINPGVRESLPPIFAMSKKFENLIGLDDGEGRNDALFKHRAQLAGITDWEKILMYINEYIFAVPLSTQEFAAVTRDITVVAEKDNEPAVADFLLNQFKILKYGGRLYFRIDGEYNDNEDVLTRLVFEKVGSQKTRYVDEVIKQLQYRAPIIPDDKTFDIKFKNGILRAGQFYNIDYDDFTPYTIDIDYIEDAAPVQMVDNYISHLTKNEPEYRDLLLEVMGHCLIVDKDFKRALAKFFIFVGGGGNGKGTFLQIMKNILGLKNCTGLSVSNMSDERYFVTLKGKLANLGDDIQDEPINNEQMKQLKNISTCDSIAARELYKQSEVVQLTATLIFTSNHILKSFEKGKAYKRRVLWCPMFTEVDENNKQPDFITRLTEPGALEYWVSLMVEGYLRLYKNHKFTESPIVSQFNTEYHQDNNTAAMYLDDMEAEDILGKRSPAIYEHYEAWAEENGLHVGSKKMLKEAIIEKFNVIHGIKKIGGKSARVFMNRPD